MAVTQRACRMYYYFIKDNQAQEIACACFCVEQGRLTKDHVKAHLQTLSVCKTAIIKIVLPEGLLAVGLHAFLAFSGLKHVGLPKGLLEIGASAFQGCTRLQALDLPHSVTHIGEQAFFQCIALDYVRLSSDLRFIAKDAFGYCDRIAQVRLPPGVVLEEPETVFRKSYMKLPESSDDERDVLECDEQLPCAIFFMVLPNHTKEMLIGLEFGGNAIHMDTLVKSLSEKATEYGQLSLTVQKLFWRAYDHQKRNFDFSCIEQDQMPLVQAVTKSWASWGHEANASSCTQR